MLLDSDSYHFLNSSGDKFLVDEEQSFKSLQQTVICIDNNICQHLAQIEDTNNKLVAVIKKKIEVLTKICLASGIKSLSLRWSYRVVNGSKNWPS